MGFYFEVCVENHRRQNGEKKSHWKFLAGDIHQFQNKQFASQYLDEDKLSSIQSVTMKLESVLQGDFEGPRVQV